MLLRVEDGLLVAWVAIASPLLFRSLGNAGPFDADQPFEGALRFAALFATVACLAARRPGDEEEREASIFDRAAVGPFVGALLLVTISAFTALGLGQPAFLVMLVAIAIVVTAMRVLVPPLHAPARRALVSPFVLVTGGLFWSLVEAVIGQPHGATASGASHLDLSSVPLAIAFFIAFSGVYYAMLIYAPRQVAEREGGVVSWLLRYAVFVAGTLLGLGWVQVLGG